MELTSEEFNREYKKIDYIAEGSFGKVYKYQHINDTKPRHAVKRIHLSEDQKKRDRMIRETKCLLRLDHPNIVKCFGYSMQKDNHEGKNLERLLYKLEQLLSFWRVIKYIETFTLQ